MGDAERTETRVDRRLLDTMREQRAVVKGRDELEVAEEALRRYPEEAHEATKEEARFRQPGLRNLLLGRGGRVPGGKGGYRSDRLPGAPEEEAEELPEGTTLSEAVLAERQERDY